MPSLDLAPDPETIQASCDTVRRYLEEALFGGDERALRETVADPELSERAWLFWAAFGDRSLDDVDVLFASADGSQVACHLTASAEQRGPWIGEQPLDDAPVPVDLDCTATYVIADNRIASFHETWR
jgi:hypothetical protein